MSEVAPTLADLKKLPVEQKCRLLLARLAQIGQSGMNALHKHNLMLPGDPYALAYGYPDAEKTPVREHLLGAPWTRLESEGYLVDLHGKGFYKLTEEGEEYLDREEPPAPQSSTPTRVSNDDLPLTSDSQVSGSGSWKVFISYSWDSEEHKAWVLAFANRLRDDGIDTVLDQTHLNLGGRTPEFMERSIRDSRNVLVICTDGYKRRFDGREGGAGYEGHIITAAVLSSAGTNKFIPILRQGDWTTAMPTVLGGVYGVDLSSGSDGRYRELVRHLHGVDKVRPVGRPPDWLHEEKTAIPGPVASKEPAIVVTPQEYWDQRKRVPDSELVKKISQMPRWCIWSRPEEFRKARFRNLDHCAQFVASASVRSHARWSQYPWFATTPEQGDESIASGIEIADVSVNHFEQWLLFQSGQFVHHMALDQVLLLGDRTHVLEILDTTTAVFEFVGRMADRGIFKDRVVIAFELKKVAGRQLTWPQDISQTSDRVGDNTWCQEESILIDASYGAGAMIDDRRRLALDVALQIYSRFGWNDPPKKELEDAQQRRFGQPVHS